MRAGRVAAAEILRILGLPISFQVAAVIFEVIASITFVDMLVFILIEYVNYGFD